MLAVDPRLAIASAVLWADIAAASTLGHTRLGLLTLPLVLLAMLLPVARQGAKPRARPTQGTALIGSGARCRILWPGASAAAQIAMGSGVAYNKTHLGS